MNIRQSVLVGLLFLFAAAGLAGCSKAPVTNASRIQEGYGKVIDPYEKKNGKVGVPSTGVHDPYARPERK